MGHEVCRAPRPLSTRAGICYAHPAAGAHARGLRVAFRDACYASGIPRTVVDTMIEEGVHRTGRAAVSYAALVATRLASGLPWRQDR